MLFSLVIIVMFVLISIYFYFRAEKLEREVVKQKQSSSLVNKENIALVDTILNVGQKNADFAKHRLKIISLKVESLEKYSREAQEQRIDIISPLINNYNLIFQDSVKAKGRVKLITKECYDSISPTAFQSFGSFIKRSEQHIARNWSSNNLTGFITLVEGLLLDFEEVVKELVSVQNIKESDVKSKVDNVVNKNT
jgi:hypothetical protein